MNYSNYDGVLVPFHNLQKGGIDNAIRCNLPVLSDTEKALLNPLFRPRDVVYDIGSYIGSHSIYFALRGATVYSFEPAKNNFDRLVENTKPFPQIASSNVALNEKSYSCVTPFKDCNGNAGDPDLPQGITYVVLEDFIQTNNLPPPNFIKIDVEGMETTILKSFDKIFTQYRPRILVELHLRPRGSTVQDYENNPHFRYIDEGGFDFNRLKEVGYRLLSFDGNMRLVGEKEDYNSVLAQVAILIPKEQMGEN